MTKPHRKGSTHKLKRGTMRSRATYIKHTKKHIHNQEREHNNRYDNISHSLTNSSKDYITHINNIILSNLSNKKKMTRNNNNYRYFSEGAQFN